MGKTKPVLFVMLLVLGLTLLSQSHRVQVEGATGGPIVRIDPPQTAGLDVNDNFTVYVLVDNAVGVEGAQVQFKYNPTVVNCTQVVEGPFLPSAGPTVVGQALAIEDMQSQPPTGEVFYASAITSGAVASGSGVLLNVTFRVVSEGGVQFHLLSYAGSGQQGTYFLDINFGEIIPSALEDGYYGSPISLSVKPEVINAGENTTLAGIIFGPAAANVPSVSLEYNKEGGAWIALGQVPTNGTGFFTYQWRGNESADFEFRVYYTVEGITYYSAIAVVTVQTLPIPLLSYIYDALIVLIIVIAATAVVLAVRKRRKHEELPP